MNLVEDVADYARQHGLWQPDSAIVIACSGGPDSMVLLDVLSRLAPLYRLRLVACYVHHGIRPAADAEVDFVRQEALRRRCGVYLAVRRCTDSRPAMKNVGRSCRTAGTLPNFTHDEAGLWGHDDCRRPSRRRSGRNGAASPPSRQRPSRLVRYGTATRRHHTAFAGLYESRTCCVCQSAGDSLVSRRNQ